jgi:hypothetical protein
MAEYKINFKAQDSVEIEYKDLIEKVKKFLINELDATDFEIEIDDFKNNQLLGLKWAQADVEEETYIYTLNVELKTVAKDTNEYYSNTPMNDKELEFFDRLGYTLDSFYSKRMNLSVYDWYGK